MFICHTANKLIDVWLVNQPVINFCMTQLRQVINMHVPLFCVTWPTPVTDIIKELTQPLQIVSMIRMSVLHLI